MTNENPMPTISDEQIKALNPLQQAALDRIDFFKKELAAKGIYVRSAMELEFIAEDANGNPISHIINIEPIHHHSKTNHFEAALKSALNENRKYLEKAGYENANRTYPYQYEINISDPSKRASELSPEMVALVTTQIKERTLKEVLLETSNLTPFSKLNLGAYKIEPPISPNFAAMPYQHRVPSIDPSFYQSKITVALHGNVSPYNKHNKNLFADDSNNALKDRYAKSLATIQHLAALAVLPNENSVQRLAAHVSAPKKIGITRNLKSNTEFNLTTGLPGFIGNSVAIRQKSSDEKIPPSAARIEDRLPGADAEPLVVMALDLAAIYNATIDNPIIPFEDGKAITEFQYDIGKHSHIIDLLCIDSQLPGQQGFLCLCILKLTFHGGRYDSLLYSGHDIGDFLFDGLKLRFQLLGIGVFLLLSIGYSFRHLLSKEFNAFRREEMMLDNGKEAVLK